ncbi:MAG: hypothetical protein WCG76_00910 [Verrucomicrobiota bacterium]
MISKQKALPAPMFRAVPTPDDILQQHFHHHLFHERKLAHRNRGHVDILRKENPEGALPEVDKVLDLIARARLPKRSKPRPAEPRAQRHLRQSFPPLIGSRAEAKKQLIAQNHEC